MGMGVKPLSPDELSAHPIKVPEKIVEWINQQINQKWDGEYAYVDIYMEGTRYEWIRPFFHPRDNPGGYQASNEMARIRSKAIVRLYKEAGWVVEYDTSIYNLKLSKVPQRPKTKITTKLDSEYD